MQVASAAALDTMQNAVLLRDARPMSSTAVGSAGSLVGNISSSGRKATRAGMIARPPSLPQNGGSGLSIHAHRKQSFGENGLLGLSGNIARAQIKPAGALTRREGVSGGRSNRNEGGGRLHYDGGVTTDARGATRTSTQLPMIVQKY